jgi:hypothetical protein
VMGGAWLGTILLKSSCGGDGMLSASASESLLSWRVPG